MGTAAALPAAPSSGTTTQAPKRRRPHIWQQDTAAAPPPKPKLRSAAPQTHTAAAFFPSAHCYVVMTPSSSRVYPLWLTKGLLPGMAPSSSKCYPRMAHKRSTKSTTPLFVYSQKRYATLALAWHLPPPNFILG